MLHRLAQDREIARKSRLRKKEKLHHRILRKHEEGSRLTVDDIFSHLQGMILRSFLKQSSTCNNSGIKIKLIKLHTPLLILLVLLYPRTLCRALLWLSPLLIHWLRLLMILAIDLLLDFVFGLSMHGLFW